jgi:hypothetical protein
MGAQFAILSLTNAITRATTCSIGMPVVSM